MSFLLILPFALTEGPAIFRTQRLREHVSRGVCGSVAMMCSFYPLTHLALAEATAIGFTKPLFLIVLAALILHESVRAALESDRDRLPRCGHGDEDLGLAHHAGVGVDDRHLLARVVDEQLVARHMMLAHHRREAPLEQIAEARVSAPSGSFV
jgi:hypothetical protein